MMFKKPFFLFFSLLFLLSSCSLFRPSPEKTYEKYIIDAPFDAIIVPGVPHDGNSWSSTMKIRVHWSNYLFKNGFTKNVIYSGSAVYSPYIEGKVMALYGEKLGIPKENIFVEDRAEHSTENAYYSYLIAKKNGFKKVALATDPFQTNNLRKMIRKYELPISLLPIVFDTLKRLDRYEPKIDAELAKKENFVALPDREGLLERLTGTLGKKIIWEEEDLKKERLKRKYNDRIVQP